jgi:hypothetical protein
MTNGALPFLSVLCRPSSVVWLQWIIHGLSMQTKLM